MDNKGLFISNHDLLSDVYAANLQIYVGLEVVIQENLKEGLKHLKANHQKLNLVISLSNIDDEDCGLAIMDLMEAESFQLPVVMIGEKSMISNGLGVLTIPANLNVKKLVRGVAGILNVTAKDMAAQDTGNLYPISIKIFKNLDSAFCDVYIKATKSATRVEYALVIKPGDPIRKKIETYMQEGFEVLYIPTKERFNLVGQVSENVSKKLTNVDASDTTVAVDILEEGHSLVALHLSQDGELNEEILEVSRKCSATMQSVSEKVPSLQQLINSMLSNKSNYLYMHTVMASYVSKHILENIVWGSPEHIEKVQFVLFFHDIHLASIYAKYPDLKYEEDLLFQSSLDDDEKELVVSHATMSSETIRTIPKSPLGADSLLAQHHGMTSGEGFALEFKDDISPLAKVIVISEEFVNQVLKQKDEGEGAISMEKIMEIIKIRFPRHSYKKIVESLHGLKL